MTSANPITITVPAIPDSSGPLAQRAAAVVVADQASLDAAGAILREAADMRKAVVAAFVDAKSAAHKAHRAVCDVEARLLAPLDAVRATVEPKVVAYQRAEQQRREEAARAEAAAARRAEEDRRLAMATDVAAAGDEEMADAILDDPIPAVAPLPVAAPRTDGVAVRETWKAVVVDMAAFIRYVAERPEWHSLIKVDQSALNAVARSQKDRLVIAGVRAYADASVAVR